MPPNVARPLLVACRPPHAGTYGQHPDAGTCHGEQPGERGELKGADYVERLQSSGYATDPKYAEKIQSIMNSDRLEMTIRDIKTNADVPKTL